MQPPLPGEALPPPAPSQSHLPGVIPTAPLRPAAALFELHPSVLFSEEYSDNFLLGSTNKVDNFRTTLSPGLLVGINGPRTRGTIVGGLAVTQDSSSSFGDFGFFPSLSAAVTHAFDPRLSLSLSDNFTRSDEPTLANQFGLRQERRNFTSNTLSLSVDWLLGLLQTQSYYRLSTFFSDTDTVSHVLGANAGMPLGRIMSARAGYEFSHTQTSGVIRDFTGAAVTGNESTGHLIFATLSRQISPLRSVGVSGSYSFQSLDNTRIGNVSFFTSYELPGRLSLSGSLGYGVLNSDSGDFSTVTSNTSASYRFARAIISVAVLQDFNQTGLVGEDFGIVRTRSYTGTFGYAVTPFIDTSLRASYSENQFTGVGNNPATPDTKTFSASASLVWRIRRWLSSSLDYTYTRYTSGATTDGDRTENRAAIRLTASF